MADLPILDELRHELREAGRRAAPAPRRRRSWLRPAIAVGAAGLATAFVVAVGPQGSGSAGPAQQPGATIEHVVYEQVNPRAPRRVRTEQWATADGCVGRVRHERPPGTVVSELSQTPGEYRIWSAASNVITLSGSGPGAGVVDPLAAARGFLRVNRSRKVGATVRDGRPMVWREVGQGKVVMRYLTAEDSLETFEVRMLRKGTEQHRVRLVTREQVPYDPSLLKMSEHRGAKVKRLKSLTLDRAAQGGALRC